jgi:predicted metal-dependent hydrolase
MDHITFGNSRITYTIKRGNRKKTLAINVTPASQVIVLAPGHLRRKEIKTFVEKKARWILAKQEHFEKLVMLFPEREFVSGEQILLLGRRYRLKIVEEENSSVPKLSGRRISVSVDRNLDSNKRKEIIRDVL